MPRAVCGEEGGLLALIFSRGFKMFYIRYRWVFVKRYRLGEGKEWCGWEGIGLDVGSEFE